MNNKKIILFGGTFDPVHLGHTTVAKAAIEYIEADRIIFIPAKCSPLKSALPRASDIDRLEMLTLAIEDEDKYEVSDYEISKPTPSFTLDTARYFNSIYGKEYALYWLVGADSIDDLIYWHRITELIDECNVAMMYRAEYERPDFEKYKSVWGLGRVDKLQKNIIPTPLVNISSTEVRRTLSSGGDVIQMLDNKVLSYIKEHKLYGI
ncbi:MAG: nicotinate (nicotinamide) nucleotide adenylyltransferase [Sedimentisphaerales bacterium]|nr:nicotinate (nicotinamide) nucleotide adenylyltransferase [Sedimentisphaerales bacterium]